MISFLDIVESEMMKQEQVECSVVHSFGPGVYRREVKIPAGTFVGENVSDVDSPPTACYILFEP